MLGTFEGCLVRVGAIFCGEIVWVRVESGTVYMSPSLLNHTISHWIVGCGGLTLCVEFGEFAGV